MYFIEKFYLIYSYEYLEFELMCVGWMNKEIGLIF